MSRQLSLPLGAIVRVSPLNPRAGDTSDISSLAATLRTVGLKHRLLVRAIDGDADASEFEVLAGQRRWRGLRALAATGEGAEIGAIDLDAIDVEIFEGDDAGALEAILAIEGEVAPLHPADLYETFARLRAHEGFDEARIARDFGRSLREVQRVLKLARMAPGVRAAWRRGLMDRDMAMAFAACPSLEAQEALCAEIVEEINPDAQNFAEVTDLSYVRHRLRGDTLTGDCAEALLVGRAAYEEAGGKTDADLLSDDEADIVYHDGALLKRLARETLMREAERIAALEGWGIAAIDNGDLNDPDGALDMTDAEISRIVEIATELRDMDSDDPAFAVLTRERDMIEDVATLRTYAIGDRAGLAVLVELGTDGRMLVTRALRPMEKQPRASLACEGDESADDRADENDAGATLSPPAGRGQGEGPVAESATPEAPPSKALRTVLDDAAAAAWAQLVSAEIGRALAVAVAALASRWGVHQSPVTLRGRAPRETDHPLLHQIAHAHMSFADAFALCAAAELADLATAFAACMGESFAPAASSDLAGIGHLFAGLAARGAPARRALIAALDHDAYFEAATKDAAVAAIRAMDGDAVAAAKMKKDQAGKTAAKLAKDRAWLPEPLATWATPAGESGHAARRHRARRSRLRTSRPRPCRHAPRPARMEGKVPRPAKGPRLYADRTRGQWIIRDGAAFRRTGRPLDDRRGADEALAAYLGEKLALPERVHRPAALSVGAVLMAYGREHAPHVAAPATIGYCIKALSPFWAGRPLTDVKGATCRDYADARRSAGVGDGTIRRELTALRAAIGHWHREHGPLDAMPAVVMPDPPPPRPDWLTRADAARLLMGALGWRAIACDRFTRKPTLWRRSPDAAQHRHVARFVLIALRTGTRHEAVLGLGWLPQIHGGWIDVERGLLYRRGSHDAETVKRRPPTRISFKLMPHLRRWARMDAEAGLTGVVSYQGRRIAKLRRGWDRAREFACLGPEVTPHILRHTRATWLMHDGVPVTEAAGTLGMSPVVFARVYGHHHPDFQSRAARV